MPRRSYPIVSFKRFALEVLLCAPFLLAIEGCKKPELEPLDDRLTIAEAGGENSLPTVFTLGFEGDLNEDTILVICRVDRHGGSWITERGICYGLAQDPRVESDSTVLFPVWDQGSIGEFRVPFLGATGGMYVRAYATNSAGTAYGDVILLTSFQAFTDSINGVTQDSFTVHGRVEGNGALVARGICYTTGTNDPTTDDTTVPASGSGFGSFSVQLTGLTAGTAYRVRVYAEDASGNVVYGQTLVARPRLCPDTIQDASGNVYNVVEIGGRCWMKENLKTGNYHDENSSLVPALTGPSWTSDTFGARCWPGGYSDSTATYGWLYNWYAVSNPDSVCPSGWEIPSIDDWMGLVGSVNGSSSALKDSSWMGIPGTNTSGFSALQAGTRDGSMYPGFGTISEWWSIVEVDTAIARSFQISDSFGILYSQRPKNSGLSIRCIRSQ